MKSEIVSALYTPPYSNHKQSIIDFIRKTQTDYFTTKIRVSCLLTNTLDPNHEAFNDADFAEVHTMIREIAEYCEANGMIFDEPKFHDSPKLKVTIYNHKKLKKEQGKGSKNFISSLIDKFFEDVSPQGESINSNGSNHQSATSNDKDNDSATKNDTSENVANDETVYDDKPASTQSLQFDEMLSACMQVQLNEVASRLVRLNKTAENAGFKVMCKLNQISIKPIDNEPDTIEKLKDFLTLYSRDKAKVIYLKQVMENISPVVANFFNVQDVQIIPEVDQEENKKPNPFANLNTETNTKNIDEKWQVKLLFSYYDQEFDALSDQFNVSKLKEENDLNMDMKLTIQDHMTHGTNARVITAPSTDFIIGRSDKADVQIFGDASACGGKPQFSREHLRVSKNGNQWTVVCLSNSPVLIEGTDVIGLHDSRVIKKLMSLRLGTRQGIAKGEYGIYPEITFNVASKRFTVEITDPSALNT